MYTIHVESLMKMVGLRNAGQIENGDTWIEASLRFLSVMNEGVLSMSGINRGISLGW